MKGIFAIIMSFALVVIAFSACESLGNQPGKEGTNFYFYPKSNIYYDVDNDQYFILSVNDGWKTVDEIPEEQKATLGEKVTLDHPGLPVWKANAEHKMIYAASLYNSQKDYREKFYQDSINSLPKETTIIATTIDSTVITSPGEENKKSGLGKFFDKIFSGKKKRDRENKERVDSPSTTNLP
jgi:hypothetical protein